jgi:hypothetical protein
LNAILAYQKKRDALRNGRRDTGDAVLYRMAAMATKFFTRFETLETKRKQEAARKPSTAGLFEIVFDAQVHVRDGRVVGGRVYQTGMSGFFEGSMAAIILSRKGRAHLVNERDATRLPRPSIIKQAASDIADLVGAGWKTLSGPDGAMA